MSLADRRSDYEWGALDRGDLADEPVSQWWTWYEAAAAAGLSLEEALHAAGDEGRDELNYTAMEASGRSDMHSLQPTL